MNDITASHEDCRNEGLGSLVERWQVAELRLGAVGGGWCVGCAWFLNGIVRIICKKVIYSGGG